MSEKKAPPWRVKLQNTKSQVIWMEKCRVDYAMATGPGTAWTVEGETSAWLASGVSTPLMFGSGL
jgi:hypothetical protein